MSNLPVISLFNFNIVNARAEEALNALFEGGRRRTAAFLNAHYINTAARDSIYRWALNKADFLMPDGAGLQLAAKMQGRRFIANLNGTDLFVPLVKAARDRGLSVFFFGSREGHAAKAAIKACEIAPGLQIAGARHGYFSAKDEDAIIADINASGAGVVLVGLGAPLQEVWIARNRGRLNAQIVMSVGAQFDFWSGAVTRAPAQFRSAGMEWAWRLALEPRRLFKRYVVGNPEFIARAMVDRLHANSDRSDIPGKRLLDLAISSAAILGFSPLMALAAIAIKLESPGPVLFRQTRIGHDGKPFTIFKFRSMYKDAERRRADVLVMSDRRGICFKAKDDPRITCVGHWLRRFSLDELPQLFNIWLGDMAIVGPRPALPQEVAAYPANARQRLVAKPGLTGLWQISGRAEIGFDKMVQMDSAYVQSRSIALDLALIALTFRAVIWGCGAH